MPRYTIKQAYARLCDRYSVRVCNAWAGVPDAQVSGWSIEDINSHVHSWGLDVIDMKSYVMAQRDQRMAKSKRKRAARRATWYAKNRSAQNAKQVARNQKRRASVGSVSVSLADVLSYHGAWCAYCGLDATTIEHVTPVSAGGATDLDNCVPACRTCNLSKGPRHLVVWLAKRAA